MRRKPSDKFVGGGSAHDIGRAKQRGGDDGDDGKRQCLPYRVRRCLWGFAAPVVFVALFAVPYKLGLGASFVAENARVHEKYLQRVAESDRDDAVESPGAPLEAQLGAPQGAALESREVAPLGAGRCLVMGDVEYCVPEIVGVCCVRAGTPLLTGLPLASKPCPV